MSVFDDLISGALDSSPLIDPSAASVNKRAHSPDDDDDIDSPTPSRKAPRPSGLNSSGLGPIVPTRLFNGTSANILTFTKQHIAGKRLKTSQVNEILDFIKVNANFSLLFPY